MRKNKLRKILQSFRDAMNPDCKAASAALTKIFALNNKSDLIPYAKLDNVRKQLKANDIQSALMALNGAYRAIDLNEMDNKVLNAETRVKEASAGKESLKDEKRLNKARRTYLTKIQAGLDLLSGAPEMAAAKRAAKALFNNAVKLREFAPMLEKSSKKVLDLITTGKDSGRSIGAVQRALKAAEKAADKAEKKTQMSERTIKIDIDKAKDALKIAKMRSVTSDKERLAIVNLMKTMKKAESQTDIEEKTSEINRTKELTPDDDEYWDIFRKREMDLGHEMHDAGREGYAEYVKIRSLIIKSPLGSGLPDEAASRIYKWIRRFAEMDKKARDLQDQYKGEKMSSSFTGPYEWLLEAHKRITGLLEKTNYEKLQKSGVEIQKAAAARKEADEKANAFINSFLIAAPQITRTALDSDGAIKEIWASFGNINGDRNKVYFTVKSTRPGKGQKFKKITETKNLENLPIELSSRDIERAIDKFNDLVETEDMLLEIREEKESRDSERYDQQREFESLIHNVLSPIVNSFRPALTSVQDNLNKAEKSYKKAFERVKTLRKEDGFNDQIWNKIQKGVIPDKWKEKGDYFINEMMPWAQMIQRSLKRTSKAAESTAKKYNALLTSYKAALEGAYRDVPKPGKYLDQDDIERAFHSVIGWIEFDPSGKIDISKYLKKIDYPSTINI